MDPSRLKSISVFQDVPEEDLRQIATFADEVSVEEGKRVVDEGDYAYDFCGIEEGEAEVLREGEHLATLGAGDFFGEIGLLEKERRNATVVAKTPMRLITLKSYDMRRIEKTMPETMEKIRRVADQRRSEA